MGKRVKGCWGFRVGDPAVPHHPLGGVHDRVQRPDHPTTPLPGSKDPAGGEEAPHDHHPGPVRPALHRAAERHRPTDGGGADRVWTPLGRADRAAPGRPEPEAEDAHRESRRVAVELVAKFHPTGGRFLIKDYPKDREHRRIKLAQHIADQLQATSPITASGRTTCCSPRPCSSRQRNLPTCSWWPSNSTSDSPNPTRPAGSTGTAPSPATTQAAANANTAAVPTRSTGPTVAPSARTTRGPRGPSPPTGTSPGPGSVTTSGNPPSTPPASASESAPTTSDTPTHPGCKWAELHRMHHSAGFVNACYLRRSVRPWGNPGRHGSPRTSCDLRCHHPLASGPTLMQPVRLQQIPA